MAEIKQATTSVDSTDDECIICLDLLTKKPAVRLIPCNHKFHRSCVEKWIELHFDLENRKTPCCYCRTNTEGMWDERGLQINLVWPAEQKFADSALEKTDTLPMKDIERMLVLFDRGSAEIKKHIYSLSTDRTRALNEGKCEEYVKDILEMTSKLRFRKRKYDAMTLALALAKEKLVEKHLEKIEEATSVMRKQLNEAVEMTKSEREIINERIDDQLLAALKVYCAAIKCVEKYRLAVERSDAAIAAANAAAAAAAAPTSSGPAARKRRGDDATSSQKKSARR